MKGTCYNVKVWALFRCAALQRIPNPFLLLGDKEVGRPTDEDIQ